MKLPAARSYRTFLTAAIAFAALASFVSLAGAAAPAATDRQAATAFRWDAKSFRTAGELRRHLVTRGVRWERFLSARPAVVRQFGLQPLPWGGTRFYAATSFKSWLESRGGSPAAWRQLHPQAAKRLVANDASRYKPIRTVAGPTRSKPKPPVKQPAGVPLPPLLSPQPTPAAQPIPVSDAPVGSTPPPVATPAPAAVPEAKPAPKPASSGQEFGVSPDNIEYADATTQGRILDEIAGVGAGWVRFDIKWAAVQWFGPTNWDWSRYDRLVDAAQARGLRILATLAYTPEWARPTSCTNGIQCAPRDMEEFGSWAQAVVQRYRGRISHWEIWNESNFAFWRPRPDAAAYVSMLKATYPRIKSADPGATVLAGGTAPAPNDGWAIDEVSFLQQVYANGGKGYFDVWSHHPYSQPHAPSFDHPDASWNQMSGTPTSIRSVLAANGDGGKKLWATEFGAPTSGSPNAVSEETQAQHLTQAFGLWKSYQWAGVLFWYGAQDISRYGDSSESGRFHGFLRSDFSRKPAWAAFKAAAS